MLKYLIAILNGNAPSFCYYKTDASHPELMPLDTLRSLLDFARSNDLSINFLGAGTTLPDSYRKEINKFKNHAKFIPMEEDDGKANNVLIINSSRKETIKDMKNDSFRNIILRVEKEHLIDLLPIVQSLVYKCKRLNLCLLDIHSYNMDDLKTYRSLLDEAGKFLVSEYKAGNPVEFNFLTDRMLLDKMNNCNAGIEHITVGPDGCFYLCPGFYHNAERCSVGNLTDGMKILNRQLMQLDHAPICMICDAFHCKRCIYLNKTTTNEVNTPSYQQCTVSHLEREASRIILSELKEIEPFNTKEPIEELDYTDPLLVLTGKMKKGIPGKQPAGKNPSKPADRETFQQEKSGLKGDFITVRDGEKIIKLPRLKQVFPGLKPRQEAGKLLNEKENVDRLAGYDLDTESVKGLLLEILKIQKQILAVLEKGTGGQK